MYISQILNFIVEYSNMPNIYMLIFFQPIEALTSLDVATFRITLRGCAQIFVKKATIYENDMTQFVFISSTLIKCEE